MTYEAPRPVGRREEHWTNGHLTVTAQRYLDRASRDTYRRTRVRLSGQGAVVVLPLLRDETGRGMIVFTRQYRYGVDEFVLELPAGRIDAGESPEAAARRELHEETGYVAGSVRQLVAGVLVSPGWNDERQWYFVAEDLTYDGTAEQDPFENVEVELVPADQLGRFIRDGLLVDAKSLGVIGAMAFSLGAPK